MGRWVCVCVGGGGELLLSNWGLKSVLHVPPSYSVISVDHSFLDHNMDICFLISSQNLMTWLHIRNISTIHIMSGRRGDGFFLTGAGKGLFPPSDSHICRSAISLDQNMELFFF